MMIALITLVLAATIILSCWLILVLVNRFASAQAGHLKETTERDLADMFVFVDHRKLALVYFCGFIVVPALVWMITRNLAFTLVGVAVPLLAPKFIVNRVRRRRLNRYRAQLPDALAMMSSSLRAGASLMTTLENLAKQAKPPLSQEFSLFLQNQKIGMSFEDALRKLEERVPLQELSLFCTGVRISREAGGNLGEMLDSLAGTVARTLQIEGKIRSLTSLGKIQGVVMASLPPIMIVVLEQLEPGGMYPLFHSLQGYIALTVIAVMETLGYLGIRSVTNIEV